MDAGHAFHRRGNARIVAGGGRRTLIGLSRCGLRRCLICARCMRRYHGTGRALVELLCVKTLVEHACVE